MLELVPVTHGNPFEDHPVLRTIWPAEFGVVAEEAAVEDLAEMPYGDVGELFLVLLGAQVVGVTGFFYGADREHLYLRWHGIVPSERRKGHSRAALALLMAHLRARQPLARSLTELVPLTRTAYGAGIAQHFASLGFVPYGEPEIYDWSPYAWQPVRMYIPEL